MLDAAHFATIHKTTTTPTVNNLCKNTEACLIYLIQKGEAYVKIFLLFRRALAGFDLRSCVTCLHVASYFATLNRPTTTPIRNDLSKQTPKSTQNISHTEIADNFLGVFGGAWSEEKIEEKIVGGDASIH